MKRRVIFKCCMIGLWLGLINPVPASAKETVDLVAGARGNPPVEFAMAEIRAALEASGQLVTIKDENAPRQLHRVSIWLAASVEESKRYAELMGAPPLSATGPQSYALRRRAAGGQVCYGVLGADAVGAMYGGLDIAEAIRLGALEKLREADHSPYIPKRGIKFNIPLDLRTPSYSDCGDSFQANIPEVWSQEFWRTYFDELARHRFNVISLWSLHPFPSIVKVPEYPEVALEDVWRTRMKLDDSFSHSGSDMLRPEMLKEIEVVKKMTIDEKIQFWREVMQMAKDRGIEVYWFTWNIFTFGATPRYGITVDRQNPVTMDYFRASVRETVLTYPLLAGMGITAGEQMGGKQGQVTPEQWLWRTYGEGIRDALKQQPGRDFRLIHRFHMTGQGEILREFKDYPGPFDFSFKYSIAHMYSLTNPPFIRPLLTQLAPEMKTWLTVRNDDIYSFRWGDPVFARNYIRCMPPARILAGFYMGPDGYCWGREAIDLEPETPRQLVLQKQWYSFMLWGRLSYDPSLPDALFERALARRFPEVPAAKLFRASAAASQIIPQTTRFFWGDIDLRWFPEACKRYRHFYDVKDFVAGETMPGSGILNIREWRLRRLAGQEMNGLTPLQIAENLKAYAQETLALVDELRPLQGSNKELRLTLGDFQAMAHLGCYYAEKILAACDLALFDKNGRDELRESAVQHLESALAHWKKYAAVATRQYKPQLLNRVGFTDLNEQIRNAEADLELAKAWKPGAVPDLVKPGGADRPFRP